MTGKFELPQKLSTLSTFGLGVYVDVRGAYWFINQSSVIHESDFYRALHEVMPIWLWGLMLLIFGTCLIVSSLLFGKRSINNFSNYFMLVGGVGSAIVHFIMASASVYNAINWLTPAQLMIMTAWLGCVGYLGGVDIYARR